MLRAKAELRLSDEWQRRFAVVEAKGGDASWMEEVEALTASNEGRKLELLSDKDGAISEYFGAELKLPLIGTKLGFSARETFLISNKGEVLDKWSEGKNMANVKSGAHAEQVLEAIDEKVDAGFSLASIFG